jgi:hypothetical protein
LPGSSFSITPSCGVSAIVLHSCAIASKPSSRASSNCAAISASALRQSLTVRTDTPMSRQITVIGSPADRRAQIAGTTSFRSQMRRLVM